MRTMTKQQMNLLVATVRADTHGDYVHVYSSGSRVDIANEDDSYYSIWRLVTLNGEDTWVQTYAWDAWTGDNSDGFDPDADALLADLACARQTDDSALPTRGKLHSAWARYAPTHCEKRRRPKGAARISAFLNCEEGD